MMLGFSQTREEAPRKQTLLAGAAVVGLLAAIAAGLWAYRKANTVETAVTRAPSDFVVTWRCLACGEATTANAAPGPRTCSKCQKAEMYPSLSWSCPRHGVQQVAFQYDSEGNPTQVKLGDGPWKPATDPEGGWNVRCPKCGGGMMPLG
jgi:hypothetical protein